MGVYCTLRSATPLQIAALATQPKFLPAFFDAVGYEDLLPRPSLWQMLLGRRKPEVPQCLLDVDDVMEIGLDKTWHGLHYLFTGRSEGGDPPAAYLTSGGIPLPPHDAHALNPSQVEAFRAFVHALPEDELRRRYDPAEMTRLHIYPDIIWERDGDEALDYILEFHQQLWAFLRDAAAETLGCIVWIS